MTPAIFVKGPFVKGPLVLGLLVAALAFCSGCSKAGRSVLRVQMATNMDPALVAQLAQVDITIEKVGGAVIRKDVTFDWIEPADFGVYLPADVNGMVAVTAKGYSASSRPSWIAVSEAASPVLVKPGETKTIFLYLVPGTGMPTTDGGSGGADGGGDTDGGAGSGGMGAAGSGGGPAGTGGGTAGGGGASGGGERGPGVDRWGARPGQEGARGPPGVGPPTPIPALSSTTPHPPSPWMRRATPW